ncbi:hypothetical protein [Glycomyces sp. NPDC021274]|jgi:hypothetical protein|uniref:hypothetical protein n=1 Tax=Glycomyces sp. NPDC021274 TaxID=3155120 RepID=UPI0034057FF7
MTYPPPGGGNPQYQLQPEPQQPSDPYSQGYNSTPPPGNYYQQQPPPQYTQPPTQPPMPPVGVQPGYPSAPGSVLPPPLPPAKQGGNLPVILGVIVVLVVVLGIAAVLIIPGMVDDDDPQAGEGTTETTEPSKEEEATTEAAEETTAAEESATPDAGGDFSAWGPPSSSEDFDPASPEGVAIAYQVAQNTGDDDAMRALVSADATNAMLVDLEWEIEDTTEPYPYPYWGMAKENDDGTMQAWAGWTLDDTAPESADDPLSGYTYTLVQEDGAWKLYDVQYGFVE